MKIGMIGYSGLVGGVVYKQVKEQFPKAELHLFNTTNINEVAHTNYDKLFISAIQAVKWWANNNEAKDLGLIQQLLKQLSQVKATQVYFISTVDVYDPPSKGDETTSLSQNIHPYGKNRLIAESEIIKPFPGSYIFRLHGLISKYLKKNYLYDLKHNNQIANINLNSSLQWYPLKRLLKDILKAEENSINLINLSCEPIPTQRLFQLCGHYTSKDYEEWDHSKESISYDISSVHANYFGDSTKYIVQIPEIEAAIAEYFLGGDDEF